MNFISILQLSRKHLWIKSPKIGLSVALMLLGAPLYTYAAVTKPIPTVVPMASHAAFDYSQTTYLVANPIITGTASSSAPLRLTVVGAKGNTVFVDTGMQIKNGRFAENIYPPIASGTYSVGIATGANILATSTITIGLRGRLRVEPDYSLASFDVADGHLMRFALQAQGQNQVGIAQLTFTIVPTNAGVTDISMYGYTDSGDSNPIVANSAGLLNAEPVQISATSSVVTIVFDTPVEIPAGSTYYFDLVGTVTPTDTTYEVETTLADDTSGHFDTYQGLAATSNIVWSPNTYGTASLTDPDWVNGDLVEGIPMRGLISVRGNAPLANTPVCTISASTSTAPTGTPLTLTWNSTDAYKASWDTGLVDAVSGTKNYTVGSTTRTYILTVTGRYGQSDCFATVVVPQQIGGGAGTTVATSTPDGITVTPVSGSIPLTTTITGSVNSAKVCTAQTFSVGYGDGATSTISVPANSCKSQSFTFTHVFTKVGTYTVGLYKGTGTSTAQRIQTQVVTTKAKVSLLFDAQANVANALSAFMSAFSHGFESLRTFLHLKK